MNFDWLIHGPMQTPILLPEKLSTSRCLVEVLDSASTDLAGDAGAVGRFGVVQHGQQQQAQLDLKGQPLPLVLINASTSSSVQLPHVCHHLHLLFTHVCRKLIFLARLVFFSNHA